MILNKNRSRYRWYVLSLVVAIFLFVHAGASVCITVLFAEISRELGLNLVQMGTVWGSISLGGVFVMLFAGMLGDRFGAKRVVTVAILMAVVFGSLRGLSTDFTSLVISSFLFGASIETIPVNVTKMVSQWFFGRQLGTSQGIMTVGVGGGFMLGSLLSATLLSPLLGGWRNVMYSFGAVSLAIAVIWLLTVREPDRASAPEFTAKHGFREALGHVIRIKAVWLMGIAMFGFSGCYQSVIGYLPLYLRNSGWAGVSADNAAALFNAVSMIATIPLLMLSDRIGRRKIFFIGGSVVGIVGVGLLSIVTGPSLWFLVIATGFVRDACYALSATITIETEGVGPEYAGTAGGLVCVLCRAGIAIGPPLGNSLASIAPGLPFVLWAGMALVALVSLLFVAEKGHGRVQN